MHDFNADFHSRNHSLSLRKTFNMNHRSVYFIVLCLLVLCVKYVSGRNNDEALEALRLRARFPFMVSIRNFNRFDCGGVLIGSHTVLTAAQCVDERYGRKRLPYMWLNATETETRTEGIMPRQAVDVRMHPNYTGDIFDGYDFAILLLNETADPLQTIAPGDPEYEIPIPGNYLTFLGFGRSTRSSSRSPYLQLVTYDIIEPAACRNSDDLVFLEKGMICLEGDTPCSGDQGGPLFEDRGAGYGNHLFGIVSAIACDLNSRLVSIPSIVVPEIAAWIDATQREFQARAGALTPEEQLVAYFAGLDNIVAEGSSISATDIIDLVYDGDP